MTQQIILKGSKENFLWYLYNDLGYTNLELQNSWVKGDELVWSKRIKYERLLEFGFDDEVPELGCTREEFVRVAGHRSVLDIEVMIDVDDKRLNYIREFKSIRDKAFWIVSSVRKRGFSPVVYKTQNKSYHVSILIPKLREWDVECRRLFKYDFLRRYGGDALLSGGHAMIAIEGNPHYRSGKKKARVAW